MLCKCHRIVLYSACAFYSIFFRGPFFSGHGVYGGIAEIISVVCTFYFSLADKFGEGL